ncbi:MAG: polyprenyl synthetase family protein [Alphaproteobacteria bacterium]|nr:polyprenyl synthetase family protein [Alphaproteobacteria bacterium]
MTQPQKKTSEASASIDLLRKLVEEDLARVNAVILTHAESHVDMIPEVARHLIDSGGKRLRPLLTLACARMCGYAEGRAHVDLAACVEFIHTATLLHDDVVDDSKLRRGLATANDLWGNKESVLVGDYLLSQAFKLMVEYGSLDALGILSGASAVIAEGEVHQLTTARNLATTVEDYIQVVEAKTARLFAAACELGAVAAEKPEWRAPLARFGQALGIAFQIVDDLLDYAAQQQTLGKTIGDDFRDGKITLPVILAYQQGTGEERAFWKRTLEDNQRDEQDLSEALTLMRRHNALAQTLELAEEYCATARAALDAFPDSAFKKALLETIRFCVERAY